MVAGTALASIVLGSSLAIVSAAPSPAADAKTLQPVKLTLGRHELKSGAKPRNRARLQRGAKPKSTVSGRATSPVSEPLQDYYLGTDLQWYGAISAGTPGQPFTVVFDTGSFSGEIPSTSCTSCGSQRKFNGAKSSTFVDYHETNTEDFGTGVGVDPSDYESYTLDAVEDTLTIAGLSAPQIQFNLITKETSGFLNDPFDGIIGMGYGADEGTVFDGLVQQGLPGLFSLYLAPNKTGGAEITLGGTDTTKYKNALTYIPVVGGEGFWELQANQIAVNGATSSSLKKSFDIIFDSGTSNLVFPSSVANAIYALISPNIKPHGSLGAYGIACSQIGSITAKLDFTFKTSSGAAFNLTIPPEELNVGPFEDEPSLCQTLINAQSGYYILGGSVLKHYYSVWDQSNSRMGFSLTSS